MPPFASLIGLLLALSVAGNLWLFHSRDKALASAAQHKTAYEGALGAANLCSASVRSLSDESKVRHAETMRRLAAQSGQVRSLEQASIEALQARPADPANLCASLEAFLKTEIQKQKGGKP